LFSPANEYMWPLFAPKFQPTQLAGMTRVCFSAQAKQDIMRCASSGKPSARTQAQRHHLLRCRPDRQEFDFQIESRRSNAATGT